MSNYSFTQVRYTTLARGSVLQYLCSQFFLGDGGLGLLSVVDYLATQCGYACYPLWLPLAGTRPVMGVARARVWSPA